MNGSLSLGFQRKNLTPDGDLNNNATRNNNLSSSASPVGRSSSLTRSRHRIRRNILEKIPPQYKSLKF